jgi:hypothetical protein
MAVIIDQMDVDVAEPQAQTRGGGESNGGGGAAQQPPKAEEIEQALRAQAERNARVWAH